MTPDQDPSFWQDAAKWLWGILAIPGMDLYRRINASASKEDLKSVLEAVKESNQRLEQANERWREVTAQLYANAESDRVGVNERFSKMQDTIHGVHVELLRRVDPRNG